MSRAERLERQQLLSLADRIDGLLAADCSPAGIVDLLARDYGARHRFANGAYELRLGGVSATATAGETLMLRAWARRARRVAEGAAA